MYDFYGPEILLFFLSFPLMPDRCVGDALLLRGGPGMAVHVLSGCLECQEPTKARNKLLMPGVKHINSHVFSLFILIIYSFLVCDDVMKVLVS